MSDEDRRILAETCRLYDKYRSMEMKDEDFLQLSADIAALAEAHDFQHNPLAMRAALMLFDTFNDLYRDGKVPPIPSYIGRDDM
jgi:hypothetical protein